jgi:hypothetical protein
MRLLFLLLLILGAGYLYLQSGQEPAVQNVSSGIISYGKETFDAVKTNGFATLEGTTVKGALEATGRIKAIHASIGSFSCNGYATLIDTRIKSQSEVNGFLHAFATQFQGPVTVAAGSVDFTDCTIDSLVIKSGAWIFGTQVVELYGNTVVKGSITFESGQGKVIKSPQSKIQGKIIGGST